MVDSEEPRYLASLLDYVHLNSIHAGLTSLSGKEGLLGYAWSGLPGYARQRGRPGSFASSEAWAPSSGADSAPERRTFVEQLEARGVPRGEALRDKQTRWPAPAIDPSGGVGISDGRIIMDAR